MPGQVVTVLLASVLILMATIDYPKLNGAGVLKITREIDGRVRWKIGA